MPGGAVDRGAEMKLASYMRAKSIDAKEQIIT